ncbi:disulfide bond formation protein B [Oleispirillum naphthae]|uniref:disulfide bond formation protein B n=1 Tax=Oleispirillum naphthae TaxID=2838853 RepID=UPI0030824B4B
MPRSPDIRVCLFLAVTSLGILAAAFVMQYVFGIDPCVLCTYQRVPYALTTGFALFGTAMPLAPARRRTVVLICAAIFAAGAALALYHVGVEQAWWAGSQGCTGETATLTLADMEKALSVKPTVRCDAVPWTLFGLSLTAYNLIASSGLTLLCLILASERRLWRERRFYPRG